MARCKLLFVFFLVIVSFSRCSTSKDVVSIFSRISLTEDQIDTSFEYDVFKKWIIVDVVVNGKVSKFMLDTGAPTVISKSFADEVGLSVLSKQEVSSVKGDSQVLEVSMVESFEVEGVKFNDVACFMSDFSGSYSIECLAMEVDGILGRNIMELLNWKIDPVSNVISVCSECTFSVSSEGYNFTTSNQGMLVDMVMQGALSSWIVDSGSGTGLMVKDGASLPAFAKHTTSVGKSLSTAFDQHLDTVCHYYYDTLELGNELVVDAEISKLDIQENIMGNGFLSHYETVIDFSTKTLYLDQVKSFSAEYNHYGFEIGLNTDGLYEVALIYSKHKRRGLGLDVGDVITRINGVELPSIVSSEFYCSNYHLSHFLEGDLSEVTVEVLKKNGVKKTIRSKLGSFY